MGGTRGPWLPVDWRVPPPPQKERKKGRELVYATTRNLSLIMTFNVQCHFDVHKVKKNLPTVGRGTTPSHTFPLKKNPGYATALQRKKGGGGAVAIKRHESGWGY